MLYTALLDRFTLIAEQLIGESPTTGAALQKQNARVHEDQVNHTLEIKIRIMRVRSSS